MARVENKTALVIGGAKGIGLAIAERLAIEGATVFLTGRRADEVEASPGGWAGTPAAWWPTPVRRRTWRASSRT